MVNTTKLRDVTVHPHVRGDNIVVDPLAFSIQSYVDDRIEWSVVAESEIYAIIIDRENYERLLDGSPYICFSLSNGTDFRQDSGSFSLYKCDFGFFMIINPSDESIIVEYDLDFFKTINAPAEQDFLITHIPADQVNQSQEFSIEWISGGVTKVEISLFNSSDESSIILFEDVPSGSLGGNLNWTVPQWISSGEYYICIFAQGHKYGDFSKKFLIGNINISLDSYA